MTARQLYENILTELNKVKAPSLLLEDYNYFINKAIGQYVNKMYNLYEVNQQKTDDLQVLRSSAALNLTINTILSPYYATNLPDDYLHILSCEVEYNLPLAYKCYPANTKLRYGARRLTSDMIPTLGKNYYLKPTYKRPFYFLNNVATDVTFPINESPVKIKDVLTSAIIECGVPGGSTLTVVKDGLSYVFTYSLSSGSGLFNTPETLVSALQSYGISAIRTLPVAGDSLPSDYNTVVLTNTYAENITSVTATGTYLTVTTQVNSHSLIEKTAEYRYGNTSRVRAEVRYGESSTFIPYKLHITYLKSPQFVKLTQTQIDTVSDTSQLLEFQDYVCQEILVELLKLLLDNSSNPRLQTTGAVNQSIAIPGAK